MRHRWPRIVLGCAPFPEPLLGRHRHPAAAPADEASRGRVGSAWFGRPGPSVPGPSALRNPEHAGSSEQEARSAQHRRRRDALPVGVGRGSSGGGPASAASCSSARPGARPSPMAERLGQAGPGHRGPGAAVVRASPRWRSTGPVVAGLCRRWRARPKASRPPPDRESARHRCGRAPCPGGDRTGAGSGACSEGRRGPVPGVAARGRRGSLTVASGAVR